MPQKPRKLRSQSRYATPFEYIGAPPVVGQVSVTSPLPSTQKLSPPYDHSHCPSSSHLSTHSRTSGCGWSRSSKASVHQLKSLTPWPSREKRLNRTVAGSYPSSFIQALSASWYFRCHARSY